MPCLYVTQRHVTRLLRKARANGTLSCVIFCGEANSLVLLKQKDTTFDVEYVKQMLGRKTERKEEGSGRKYRPTSRQEERTISQEENTTIQAYNGENVERDKRKL